MYKHVLDNEFIIRILFIADHCNDFFKISPEEFLRPTFADPLITLVFTWVFFCTRYFCL